ncbi:MAG: hypothetical protein IJM44_02410 [Ruminococcus sp.]|nr:hypothetical protein [Ruminococcus sp.]
MDSEMRGILARFLIGFVLTFVLVMILFIRKPHIAKSRNRCVRAAVLFALVFVPGVLAASVCAKSITSLYGWISGEETGVTEETEEDAELRGEGDDRGV